MDIIIDTRIIMDATNVNISTRALLVRFVEIKMKRTSKDNFIAQFIVLSYQE